MDNASALESIPGVIVQGRYDMVCPVVSAADLSRTWPGGRFVVVSNAGHSTSEGGIIAALVDATNELSDGEKLNV